MEKLFLENVFGKLNSAFIEFSIDYMIIGGQAVLYYGNPRLTQDIDVTLGLASDRLNTILNLCSKFKIKPLPQNIEDFVLKTNVLPCNDLDFNIRIDFIFSFSEYERQAIKRANIVKLNSISIKIAAFEDVVIHKIFAGRARDIEDIRILLKSYQKKYDKTYIETWLKRFSDIPTKENLWDIFYDLQTK